MPIKKGMQSESERSEANFKMALKKKWYFLEPEVFFGLEKKFLQKIARHRAINFNKLKNVALRDGDLIVEVSGRILFDTYILPINEIIKVEKSIPNFEISMYSSKSLLQFQEFYIKLYYKNNKQEILIPTILDNVPRPHTYTKSLNGLYSFLLDKVQSSRKKDITESIKEYAKTLEQLDIPSTSEKLQISKTEILAIIEEMIATKEIDAKIDGNNLIFLANLEKREKRDKEVQEETAKQEKESKIKQGKESIEKLKQIFKVSDRIKLNIMRDALNLDETSFNNKIINWTSEFGFKISGDELFVNESKVSPFITALHKQYGIEEQKESQGKTIAEGESVLTDDTKEKQRKERIINLFKISDSININDLAAVADLPRMDVINKLIEWKDQFKIKIDGDYVRIDKGDLSNVLNQIDKSMDEWNSELRKSQKKL